VSLAGVADAAVIGVADDKFGESVLAFVELQTGAEISAELIVSHCRSQLAAYKKPRHVVFVAEMPRTASGKIRKPQLRIQHARILENL
jgi:acyl-coenzyme A synthetase/AMP-(fatty) acid ligase